jgi:transcription initiation factor TFIID subunit TAF12
MPMGRMGRPGLLGMAARTAVVAGTATAVSGNVQRRQQGRADAQSQQQQDAAQQQQQDAMNAAAQQAVAQQQATQAAAAPPPAAGSSDDMMAQLQQLATMHSQGILSDEEFAAAKAKTLGSA